MTSTPESALVERLRKCAKIVHLEPGRSPLEEEYLEAAATIERLQARVAELERERNLAKELAQAIADLPACAACDEKMRKMIRRKADDPPRR